MNIGNIIIHYQIKNGDFLRFDWKSIFSEKKQPPKKMDPIALTEEQITNILSEVPKPRGIGKSAIQIAHQQLLSRLRNVLEDIKLVPVEEDFQTFKREIIRDVYESFIEPSRPVGVTAGVSLGGPITQMSLNTFHFAGAQSGVAQAFQKVRDALVGSRIQRDPQMSIFFKNPGMGTDIHDTIHIGTFESIMGKRAEFEQTMVSDVIQDIEILTRDEAEAAGVSEIMTLHSLIHPEKFVDASSRYRLNHVVELRLNMYRMYSHRITMDMLAKAIEGPAPPDCIVVIWKSQFDGKMYIIVDETKSYGQQGMSQEASIIMFLTIEIIRKFNDKQISGISGIYSIEPQEIDVVKGIHRIEKSKREPDVHYVYTNNFRTRWEGVSLADIRQLLKACEFTVGNIRSINKERLFIKVKHKGNVWTDLNSKIKDARSKSIPERSEREQAIINATSFYIMKAKGINMDQVIWRDDVDVYRVISNDSHGIQETLGIDAARVFLILKFRQTLQEFSSYINGRHIALIFDLLTNLGTINSLSFTGVNRRRVGPLAAASYERAMDVFTNSAVYGDKESIVGVSPALYVGHMSKRVGTGSIGIEEDLTIVPHDRPTLPTIDENTMLDDIIVEEDVIEGSGLAEIITGAEIMRIRQEPGMIDKSRIRRPAEITNVSPDVPSSIIPEGAHVVMASQTLMNALNKVTNNTGLTVEPTYEIPQRENPSDVVPDLDQDIPDITEISDISDISIITPQQFRPESPPTFVDIISQLAIVPTEGVSVKEQPITVPEIPIQSIEPTQLVQTLTSEPEPQFTLPGGPVSPTQLTGSISDVPIIITDQPMELSQPGPIDRIKGIITTEDVPQIPPVPQLPIPPRPRSVIEPSEGGGSPVIRYAGIPAPSQIHQTGLPDEPIALSSLLEQLPNMSDIASTVQASSRGHVAKISASNFMGRIRRK